MCEPADTCPNSLGHEAGDELLVAVARRLIQAARPSDTVARFGGDEFIVLCENIGDADAAVSIADRICSALPEPVELTAGTTVRVTASVGIALLDPETPTTAEELISSADSAMYLAKARSLGRYQISDDDHLAQAA